MATLKREIKKLPSEQNLRLLSSLVISLANKTSSVEDKCITPWKAGETYQKDVSLVIYNGYIYSCAVTNKDAVFTESHWTKLADNFDELSVEDVKAMLNLSQEELDNLQKLLKDDQITTTSTFSSSKIFSDLQAAIDTAKEYTNNQLGKAVKPAYKVVSSTSEVTETGYFYLISNGTNFDMYVLSADGTVVSLGTSEVDLSNYYTKTETDNDFLKKTDADGKYATITTVDGKVDKTNIATAISSTPSVDKVASEKAVYDKNTINHKTIQGIDILDYASKVVDNFEFVRGFNVINSPYGDNDSPNNDMLYMINRISVSGYCRLIAYDLRSTFAYMRTQLNSTWTDWVRLSVAGGTEDYQTLATPQIKDGAYMSNSILWGTDRDFIVFDINKPDKTVRRLQFDTVEKAIGMYDLDYSTNAITEVGTLRFQKTSYVPPTDVTFTNPNVSKARENEVCKYCVKNGVCYVTLNDLSFSSDYKSEESFVVLPKPAMRQDFELTDSLGTTVLGKLFLEENGAMHLYTNTIPVTATGYISFSYPVAE